MSQINVTKLNAYVHTGSKGASVSKLNMYARLIPGEGDFAGAQQAHVWAQKLRRG